MFFYLISCCLLILAYRACFLGLFFSYEDQELLANYNESLKNLKESYDRCVSREIWQTVLSIGASRHLSIADETTFS